MKKFKEFIIESDKSVGKKIGTALYVHKDYIDKSNIPSDVYHNAVKHLKANHPNFEPTIIKHDTKTNNISFLHSPDWDSAPEPHIRDSVLVKHDGETKYMKPKSDPQIYHQKHQFVKSDYKGFDVNKSKDRFKKYTAAIKKVADEQGVPTKQISSRIGTKSYWDKHIVPRIED